MRMLTAVSLAAAACGEGPATGSGPTLTLAETGASNPTVAVGSAGGVAYVAWVAAVENTSDVWLATARPGGTTTAPVRVNDIEGDAAPHLQAPAQVAAGPEGHVYVAWQNNTVVPERRFPTSDLRFARSVDGGLSFGPAITVNDDGDRPPSSHTFHNLLVAPNGDVVVSWLDGREGAAAEAAVSPAALPAGHEGHDMGAEEGPGPSARVAVSHDGGATFGPSVVVDENTCPCCRTAMAAAPGGTIWVAWRKVYEGDVRDVVVARSRDGGASFEPPVRVAPDDWVFPGCPHAGPALTLDADGALHVAWYTGREGGAGLYHAVSRDGGSTFEPARALLTDGWVPPSQVSMAAGSGGALWLAWEDRRDEQPVFLLSSSHSGTELALDRAARIAGSNPALASGAGMGAVAWLDGSAVRLRFVGSVTP
jgi:hypothetical protein